MNSKSNSAKFIRQQQHQAQLQIYNRDASVVIAHLQNNNFLSVLKKCSGAPLFFRFLIMLTIAGLIPMLVYSVITTLQNLKSNFIISDPNLSQSWAFRLSNINSVTEFNELYLYLLAGSILILLIIIPLITKLMFNIFNKIYNPQNPIHHIQHLSALIKLEKPANYTQSQITKSINQWFQVQCKILQKQFTPSSNIVQKIYFHYNIQLFERITKQLEDLEAEKIRQQTLQQLNNSFQIFQNNNTKMRSSKASKVSKASFSLMSKKSSKTVFSKISQIQNLKQKIRKKQLEKTNKFVVVFKNLDFAQIVKNGNSGPMCKKKINQLIFPGEIKGRAYEAPFPRQVSYRNQHLVFKQKLLRRILSWAVTFFIIAFGSGIEFGVLYLYLNYGLGFQIQQYAAILMAGLFVIINQICIKLASLLVVKQQQPNLSHQITSLNMHNLVINMFIKCISIFIIYVLQGIQFYSYGGLAEMATWIVIESSALTVLSRFINYRLFFACNRQSKILKSHKRLSITQIQANQMLQRVDGKMYLQYSQLSSILMISFAYASISPITLIVCSFCFIFSLIYERFCFVYLYKQPQPTSQHLFSIMASVLWKSPLFLILGQLHFIYFTKNLGSQASLPIKIIFSLLLGITLIIAFIPASFINKPVVMNQRYSYEQIKQKLYDYFQHFNPLYTYKVADPIPKSTVRVISKNQVLQSQLNTMSKTLESTLREKLFSKRPSLIEGLIHKDEPSQLYFQFDQKVKMPQKKKVKKYKVPPIFKVSKQEAKLKKKSQALKKSKQNQNQLIKLSKLVPFQQQQGQKLKHKIKQAIRTSINKIN